MPTSSSITTTTATLGGQVISCETTVTGCGVVISRASANTNPMIGGAAVTTLSTNGGIGAFTVESTGLEAGNQYCFRAYAVSSAGTTYSNLAYLTTQAATHTHQELWRFANFGSYDSSANGADSADPDGDGLNNLLEYALGQDPNASGVIGATLALNGGNLEYTYTRSTAAKDNGVTYQIEWSDTLDTGSWSTENVTEQIQGTQGAQETVKASIPRGNAPKRFLRLRVAGVPQDG